jgi:carbonic anhydrase
MTKHHRAPAISAQAAQARLARGNARFVGGHARFLTGLHERRTALAAAAQRPYAAILGCSDSRVAPELVFDAGLGELFVVRVAGNVATPGVMGSPSLRGRAPRDPAAGRPRSPGMRRRAGRPGKGGTEHWKEEGIEVLMEAIIPGLADVDRALDPAARMDEAVEANVRWVLRRLGKMPQARREREDATIVGAVYELRTGRVRFLT